MKMQSNFPIQPIGNKLIALPIEKQEEKVGSIIIPGTVNMNLLYAKVVAVSSDEDHKFKVGDVVIHPEGTGIAQMIAGKTYIYLQYPEVWALDNRE